MKQKTKQKVITEREIIRFRQCLYKAEKSPSTIDKYVRDVRKLQAIRGRKDPNENAYVGI